MKNMKRLLAVLLLLCAFACSTEESIPIVEDTNGNSTFAKGCQPCAVGQQLDCPPAKNYDWSKLELIKSQSFPDRRQHYVIVGDGFTAAEEAAFDTAAEDAKDAIITLSEGWGRPMVYKAFMPSVESGLSVDTTLPVPAIPADIAGFKNTVFNTYSNGIGLTRLLGMYHTNRFELQQDLIGTGDLYWDDVNCVQTEGGIFDRAYKEDAGAYFAVYVLVVSNTTLYSAGAEYLDIPSAVTADVVYETTAVSTIPDTHFSMSIVGLGTNPVTFKQLIEHEMGHSVWNFADLYPDTVYPVNAALYAPIFWNAPKRWNIADVNRQTWGGYFAYPSSEYMPDYWKDCDAYDFCIDPWETDPATLTDPYPYIYGAGYLSNMYKSSNTSKMNVLTEPFSELENKMILMRIEHDKGQTYYINHPYWY